MKRWLTIVAVGTVCLLIVAAFQGARFSLQAERTLHAYYLVLDLVGAHVSEHDGAWPTGWDDLVPITPGREGAGWRWPQDRAEIEKRIRIDFSLVSEEVAAMSPDSFVAVNQIGPCYDHSSQHHVVRLIDRVQTSLGSTTDEIE